LESQTLMPRHSAFVPLSHDHHHTLVLALRLKKGGPTTHKDRWPSDFVGHAKAALEMFEKEIAPHFQKEEEVLFQSLPPAVSQDSEYQTLVAVLKEHHAQIRHLFGSVSKSISNLSIECLEKELEKLGELLDKHIRLEERQLFPLLERLLSAQELQEIELRLAGTPLS
jgi:hemerythrin-like domain-containing protein